MCQQSEKHLDKILNVDEFVKRIFTVIHSNDPVSTTPKSKPFLFPFIKCNFLFQIARSLALRTLGSMAIIISERKSIQHSIRDALDSHDAVELEAAIYAASKFAAHSRTFSVNMCSKIAEMIRGPATPVPIQLKLIPVLQYMHHDASTAAMVRSLCVQLLPSYPAGNFVCVTLHTLTLLAGETLVEIPQQLLLLLDHLRDSRRAVQAQVLADMTILADKGAHLWTSSDVEALAEFLLDQPHLELQRRALDVLVRLATTEATTCFHLKADSKLNLVWSRCCYSSDLSVAAKAVQLLIQLVITQPGGGGEVDLSQEAAMAVESLILNLCHDDDNAAQLKIALASAVQLSGRAAEVGAVMVDCLVRLLVQTDGSSSLVPLCQSLAAIGDTQPAAIVPAMVDIMALLQRLSPHHGAPEETAIPLLCVLMFQAHVAHDWSASAAQVLDQAVLKVNHWTAFRVARSAARYGHHWIAHGIIQRLLDNVSTEHLHFWLRGLSDFTLAESHLSGTHRAGAGATNLMDRLVLASKLYLQGLSSLKAAANPSRILQFQAEFARLRVEFLSACSQLVQACRTMQTAPPPAVAIAVAAATRDELQRCGRITGQLRKSVAALRHSAELLAKLRQSAFDADLESLANLQLQQQMALVVAETVELTCLRTAQQGTMSSSDSAESQLVIKTDQSTVALRSMADRLAQAAGLAKRFRADHADLKLINHVNVGCVLECLKVVTETPLCLPRFFFQTLQNTTVTLAVNPQPRVAGEPVTSTMGQQMAVRVEGIIQLQTAKSSAASGRRVRAVQVTLTSQPNSPAAGPANNFGPDGKPIELATVTMSKTVEPHNDYFSARFLLTFTTAGLHLVNVEAALLDESDALWNAGAKAQLSVKIFEETGAAKSSASGSSGGGASSSGAGRAAAAVGAAGSNRPN